MKMNKKAVSPVIAVMLLVAVAVAAVGAYFIWYKSFQASSQKNVEQQTGTIGSKLRVTNITNAQSTFYITIKNATGETIGHGTGAEDITIVIKDDSGNTAVDATVEGSATTGGANITGSASTIADDEEGQIEATVDSSYNSGQIKPGETYTIIITAAGVTTTEKYTAI